MTTLHNRLLEVIVFIHSVWFWLGHGVVRALYTVLQCMLFECTCTSGSHQ